MKSGWRKGAAVIVLSLCLSLSVVPIISAHPRMVVIVGAIESIPIMIEESVSVEEVETIIELPPIPPAPKLLTSAPIKISIPTIDMLGKIIEVGVTAAGNLDVPPNYTEVGWYKYGTHPGEVGSAVLDGHVDNGRSIDGPFKRLHELKVGDDIFVTNNDGTQSHFEMVSADVFHYKQFPGETIFHDASDAWLKIITCHGTFLPAEDTYDQRLVVTARLVP